jgi:hypothetical protein
MLSQYISKCPTMSHNVSVAVKRVRGLSQNVSKCLTVSHNVSQCLILSHNVSKCLNQSKELRVQDIFVHNPGNRSMAAMISIRHRFPL